MATADPCAPSVKQNLDCCAYSIATSNPATNSMSITYAEIPLQRPTLQQVCKRMLLEFFSSRAHVLLSALEDLWSSEDDYVKTKR